MTIIVGLTGGIASGKTTLSNFLKNKKFAVHDSDLVVKKIYSRPSPFFLKHLKKLGLSHSIKNNKIKTYDYDSIVNFIPKLYAYRLPTKKEWENMAHLGYSTKTQKILNLEFVLSYKFFGF